MNTAEASIFVARRTVRYIFGTLSYTFWYLIVFGLLGSGVLISSAVLSTARTQAFVLAGLIGLSLYFSQILVRGRIDEAHSEESEIGDLRASVLLTAFISSMLIESALFGTLALGFGFDIGTAVAVAILTPGFDSEVALRYHVSPAFLTVMLISGVSIILAGLSSSLVTSVRPSRLLSWPSERLRFRNPPPSR